MKKNLKTCIEITDSTLKVLQAKAGRGDRTITFADGQNIEGHTDAEVVKVLSKLTSPISIESKDLVLMVPRRFAILKQISVPSQADAEIRQMASLQAAQDIPYTRDEIVFDFVILDQNSAGYSKILLVIIPTDIITKYMNMVQSVNLSPSTVTISSIGILQWLVFQNGRGKVDDKDPIMVVHVDYRHSEICFMQHQKLLFSRHIAYGATDLLENRTKEFEEQVKLSSSAYQKQRQGGDISQVIVLSALGDSANFCENLQKKYDVPIEIFNHFDNIPCHKNLANSKLASAGDVSIAACSGILLSSVHKKFSLIPQEHWDSKAIKNKKRELVRFALIAAMTFVFFLAALSVESYRRKSTINQIDAQYLKIEEQLNDSKKKIRFLKFMKDKFEKRILFSEILKELSEITPQDINFRSFSMDAEGMINIRGFAKSTQGVNQFQDGLVASILFKNVNLQFATKRKSARQELTDFKIACQLNEK